MDPLHVNCAQPRNMPMPTHRTLCGRLQLDVAPLPELQPLMQAGVFAFQQWEVGLNRGFPGDRLVDGIQPGMGRGEHLFLELDQLGVDAYPAAGFQGVLSARILVWQTAQPQSSLGAPSSIDEVGPAGYHALYEEPTAMADASAVNERPGESEQLLPGENRNSRFRDDAEHWIAVYSEFLRFKQDLLATVEAERAELSDEVAAALSTTVLSQLTRQHDRLRRRLSFWQTRLAEIKSQG
jgi:hypothetical protein